MNVQDAIRAQRAIRNFADAPAAETDIDAILDAGRRAPSSRNDQRWSFVVVRDRDRLRALATVGDYAGHLAGATFAVALVVPDSPTQWERESIAYDLGQATQNMLLAGWDRGIGSVHAAVYDEPKTRAILGLPEGMRCDYVLSFGVPEIDVDMTAPREPDRRPLSDLRHDETYQA
jgi:nitroreductase